MWGLDAGVGGGLAGRWPQYAWPAPGTRAVLINLLTTTASAESAANYRNTPQRLGGGLGGFTDFDSIVEW